MSFSPGDGGLPSNEGPESCGDIIKRLDPVFDIPDTPVAPPKSQPALGIVPGQEHMKVFLRIRPFTENETNKNENQVCMQFRISHGPPAIIFALVDHLLLGQLE